MGRDECARCGRALSGVRRGPTPSAPFGGWPTECSARASSLSSTGGCPLWAIGNRGPTRMLLGGAMTVSKRSYTVRCGHSAAVVR
ncbi:hypothetical protein MINT15_09410 [Saccharomonospora viridis]|uniref:Uncharacterized protein n=1 Tax=Saccharomonospora viridis TaxID=1852 RepID=A0A837D884_9PSEU|nr:hypothetical protein MINT15_09410 [Saccharomonospora viridis]